MKIPRHLREELKEGRLAEFVIYHLLMDEMNDIDPTYPMMRYICDRYELNIEQRYWLAFLFAATYSAPTVFYIYNEFPDYENVDVGRLWRWWKANKQKTLFQTDRLWIRSRDQFVPMFESYRDHIGEGTQEEAFNRLKGDSLEDTYKKAYKYFISTYQFGRFSMFLYLESVYVVTGFPMTPDGIDWKNAQSSRNGLCFALGYDDLLRGHGYGKEPIAADDFELLAEDYEYLLELIAELKPESRADAWNVETTLCAYKKWRLGQDDPKRIGSAHYRYPGYYLDRQYGEIVKLEDKVTEGVDWDVLWDFREEVLCKKHLIEYKADNAVTSEEEMKRRVRLFEQQGELL